MSSSEDEGFVKGYLCVGWRCVFDKILIVCLGCMVMNNLESGIKYKFIKIRKLKGIFFYFKICVVKK